MTTSPTPSSWTLLFAAWALAATATAGSLFFSVVMELPPCTLCWWQRIALFPLVLVLPAGLFPYDPRAVRYALPLASAGLLVAAYHVLVYYGVVPESLQPCSEGVSCSQQLLQLFGFLDIPLLSFLGFLALVTLLGVLARRSP